jgi:hypothetical protein
MQDAPANLTESKASSGNGSELRVAGMTCNNCARKVTDVV